MNKKLLITWTTFLLPLGLLAQDTSFVMAGGYQVNYIATPTEIKASDGSIHRITVNWKSVADAEQYFVKRGESSKSINTQLGSFTSTGMSDGVKLKTGILYYYKIQLIK